MGALPVRDPAPEWILEALQVLRPAGRETVSEWADRNRVLGSGSAVPGRWRTSFTPYLREIMDSYDDPEIEEVAIIKPTQVGGTEACFNILARIIAGDPAPTMVVYPTIDVAEGVADDRLRPMVESCPALAERFDPGSKRMALRFDGMTLVVAGANSPASLASRAVRNLVLDEIDKYPVWSGKEADPISLARERTKTFDNSRKIFLLSTPTFEAGAIWQEWLAADTQYEYFVSCPHCGAVWTFAFGQLRFDPSSPDAARASAVYVCPECDAVIDDGQKTAMVQSGRWKAVRERGRRKVAFRFSSFLSPWLRLGDLAEEFVRSKDNPAKLMNFINSWLGEPYKEVESTMSAEWVREKRSGGYPARQVPDATVLITGGVDVQRSCFYLVIRAWRANMASFKLAHAKVFSWREVEWWMNRTWFDRAGVGHIVNLCCVDSGDQTDDVYDFCAINREWAVPVKGASGKLDGRYRRSVIDRAGSRADGQVLYVVDTNHYKDTLFARMHREEEEGGWFVEEDCDPEYCEMVTAEHKVVRKYGGRLVSVWEQKAQGRDNHYWDCEVYAALAADLCGIRGINASQARAIREDTAAAPAAQKETAPQVRQPPGDDLGAKWFGR